MKSTTKILILTTCLALSATAMARDHERDRRGPDHDAPLPMQITEQMHKALRRLDLSDEQKTAVRAEFNSMKENTRPLLQEMREARGELHQLLIAEDYDRSAVAKLADRQGEITAELIRVAAGTVNAVKSHLTEEQLAELEQMRSERHDRMEKRLGQMQKRLERLEQDS